MSDPIRVVLVDAAHPGNVGASARAMKNMGFDALVLVRPAAHPDPVARARAAGAADLLERARVAATVDEAIGDCGLVLGTTARARSASFRVLDARAGALEAAAAARARPVAVLFGGERNGLSNAELARCDALLRITTGPEYASLNLAQAVQIVCYELRMALGAGADGAQAEPPATADERLALDAHLERVMRASGFMHAGNAVQLGPRVQRLLARARPDAGEVRILRGWLAALERRLPPAE